MFVLLLLCASLLSCTSFSAPPPPPPQPFLSPKEACKLFGRIADKYILLDASAGLCCYSACSDCEFRDPDGGYRMADMSAARPKWVCSYARREFKTEMAKQHTSAWAALFSSDKKLGKAAFVEGVAALPFAAPLGGPYLSAKEGAEMGDGTGEALFELLGGGEFITERGMERGLKKLGGGAEEGIVWKTFLGGIGGA